MFVSNQTGQLPMMTKITPIIFVNFLIGFPLIGELIGSIAVMIVNEWVVTSDIPIIGQRAAISGESATSISII